MATSRSLDDVADGGVTWRAGVPLVLLLVGQFMANVDTAIVNVAVPAIKSDLSAGAAALELVVSGYVIAYAVLLTTAARLSVRFGFDRVFTAGVVVFTAASLLCGLAGDVTVLIAARVVQGLGAALLVAQVLIGIQTWTAGRSRARALGWYSIAVSGAGIVGQVLGGVLVTADLFGFGWRMIFLVNVPIGVAIVVASARLIPRQPRSPGQRIDIAGMVLLSATVLFLIVPLVFGPDSGWGAWVLVCLALVVPIGGSLAVVERRVLRRGHEPVVNLEILRRAPIGWGTAANIAGAATYFTALFVVALYFQRGLGVSALESGTTFILWVCGFGAGGMVMSRVPAGRVRHCIVTGYLILASGYAIISAITGAGASVLAMTALLGVCGFGIGLAFNALIRHLAGAGPVSWAPDISGFINTSTQVAAALGIAAFGGIYLAVATEAGPTSAEHATPIVFVLLAATALGAAIAGYLSGRSARVPAATPSSSAARNNQRR